MAIFYWEWGQNLAPREGQKMPCFGKGVVQKNIQSDKD